MEHRASWQLTGSLSMNSSCGLCGWLLRSMTRWWRQSHRRGHCPLCVLPAGPQGVSSDPLPLADLPGAWGEASPAAQALLSCHEEWGDHLLWHSWNSLAASTPVCSLFGTFYLRYFSDWAQCSITLPLVCLGCYSKGGRRGSKQQKLVSHSTGVWKSEFRDPACSGSGEDLFQVADCQLLAVALCAKKREWESSVGSFYKNTKSIHESSTCITKLSPKDPTS